MFAKKCLDFLAPFCPYPLPVFPQSSGNYDQHEAFAPIFYPAFGDEVRTAAGTPGPKYWQNEANYNIQATLDDEINRFQGAYRLPTKITVRSPFRFYGSSWIRIFTNQIQGEKKSTPVGGGRYANQGFDGGYTIQFRFRELSGQRRKNSLYHQ